MQVKRVLRHLWMGHFHIRSLFPRESLQNIASVTAQSEARHRGEIRFAVEASLDWGPLLKGVTARERAVQVFSDLRVWDTEENSGVLIYLLLADRDVEIVSDRGIHAKVGAQGWEDICHRMEEHFRQGRFEAGVTQGLQEVSRHLESHFPRRENDVNELPDEPVVM